MIERVPVATRTRAPGGETNAHVVGADDPLLIDPAGRVADLGDLVATRDVAHVAVTHHHPDHVGGVAHYAREHDLTVWARYGRVEEFAASTGLDPDRTFTPGTVLPAGDGIEVVDTPGHAPEHVAFGAGTELVTGDLVVAAGSVVVGAPEGDVRAYLASLRRLYARDPDRVYPAHGPVVEDPRGTCERLLDHRLDRERSVLRAVRAGADTPRAVVEAAYEKDVSDVADLARATVVAHLQKLAVEGTVRWEDDRIRPA